MFAPRKVNTHNCEKRESALTCIKKNKMLYLFLVPGIILVFIFAYCPLPGLLMSFMDYDMFKGFKSDWVGFDNIIKIFTIPEFSKAILNTVWLSLLGIIIGFPLPIIFALMLNELNDGKFKKFTQTVSYLPHFLSTIAVIGMAVSIYSEYGILNDLRIWLFGENTVRELFLTKQNLFVPNILILSNWKGLGWSSVIYLAAISGVDSSLYEAAIVDGAGKFRQCLHITIPSISTTIIMLFILKIGSLFNSDFELIYGLQNVYIDFEVISTVIYKQGITGGNYSVSTAFGFVQGVVSLVLVLITNYISKRVDDVSLI